MTLAPAKAVASQSGIDVSDSQPNCFDDEMQSKDVPSAEDTDANGSTGWKPWGYKRLVKLVAKAKGAASKQVLEFIQMHMRGTKLILVMGQAGTGKTSILEELSGLKLGVGHEIESGTLQYQVCPAVIDGEQYLFIDTAGFGAADVNNMDNFHDIMGCLTVLGPFVTIAGVLFVYGFPQERLNADDLRTIRWIQCFCGPDFFSNITMVTSKWDKYSNHKSFPNHWRKMEDLSNQEDVKRILSPPGRFHGGAMYHHGLPEGRGSTTSFVDLLYHPDDCGRRGDELRNLIRRRYRNSKPSELQILREMKQKIPMSETQAAKVLEVDVTKSSISISDHSAVLSAIGDDGKSSNGDQRGSGPGSAKPQADQDPVIGSKPEKGTSKQSSRTKSGPSIDESSWLRKIIQWVIIARNASGYFENARKKGHESSNRGGSGTGPEWRLWSSVKDWWFGSAAA